jgi:hypothetical protein
LVHNFFRGCALHIDPGFSAWVEDLQ